MLNCREMALLGSAVIDKQLSFGQRMNVMLHLRQCKHCRLYLKQLALTSAVIQKLPLASDNADVDAMLAAIQEARNKRTN